MTEVAAPHLFVVEDEPRLAQLVADYLKVSGYTVSVFGNGQEAVDAFHRAPPALMVLDLMLPGLDGLSVCREVRRRCELPIIMLTARVEEVDRLLGLEAGADDYICKPFSPREVVARVKAVLRRSLPKAEPAAAQAPLHIDDVAYVAHVDGQRLDLTPVEFRLLSAFAATPGRVYSRSQLLDRLHDDDRALSDRTVDSHIKNLRRKLEQARAGWEPIRSVYGVGYGFEP